MRAAAVLAILLAGCTSEQRVKCATQATCDPFGAVCVDGVCRKPSELDLSIADQAIPRADLVTRCEDSSECTLAVAPICDAIGHTCRPCAGDCPASTPLCLPSGECVECATTSDCTAKQRFCDASGRCAPCTSDVQCELGYCAEGQCARGEDLVYVDRDPACPGARDGTAANPYCDIAAGVATGKPFVIVKGTTFAYSGFLVQSTGAGFVRIAGPGRTAAMPAIVESVTQTAVSVQAAAGATARVIVSGMHLIGGAKDPALSAPPGVDCFAAVGAVAEVTVIDSRVSARDGVGVRGGRCSLALRDDFIVDTKSYGVAALGGKLDLRRTRIAGNAEGALLIDSAATYAVENNLLVQNGGPSAMWTVWLGPATSGTFSWNGVFGNAAGTRPTIMCDTAVKAIETSLFAANTGSALFSGNCTFDGTVTPPGSGVGTEGDPQYDASYQLVPGNAKNLACCIDKRSSGPALDYFGNARPKGAGWDLGPHEVE